MGQDFGRIITGDTDYAKPKKQKRLASAYSQVKTAKPNPVTDSTYLPMGTSPIGQEQAKLKQAGKAPSTTQTRIQRGVEMASVGQGMTPEAYMAAWDTRMVGAPTLGFGDDQHGAQFKDLRHQVLSKISSMTDENGNLKGEDLPFLFDSLKEDGPYVPDSAKDAYSRQGVAVPMTEMQTLGKVASTLAWQYDPAVWMDLAQGKSLKDIEKAEPNRPYTAVSDVIGNLAPYLIPGVGTTEFTADVANAFAQGGIPKAVEQTGLPQAFNTVANWDKSSTQEKSDAVTSLLLNGLMLFHAGKSIKGTVYEEGFSKLSPEDLDNALGKIEKQYGQQVSEEAAKFVQANLMDALRGNLSRAGAVDVNMAGAHPGHVESALRDRLAGGDTGATGSTAETAVRPREAGSTPAASTNPSGYPFDAEWTHGGATKPIKVTGVLGKGKDGKIYLSVEGLDSGVPLDEINLPGVARSIAPTVLPDEVTAQEPRTAPVTPVTTTEPPVTQEGLQTGTEVAKTTVSQAGGNENAGQGRQEGSVEGTATVHGDLRTPTGQGEGPVPVEGGGEGVRPNADQGTPQAGQTEEVQVGPFQGTKAAFSEFKSILDDIVSGLGEGPTSLGAGPVLSPAQLEAVGKLGDLAKAAAKLGIKSAEEFANWVGSNIGEWARDHAFSAWKQTHGGTIDEQSSPGPMATTRMDQSWLDQFRQDNGIPPVTKEGRPWDEDYREAVDTGRVSTAVADAGKMLQSGSVKMDRVDQAANQLATHAKRADIAHWEHVADNALKAGDPTAAADALARIDQAKAEIDTLSKALHKARSTAGGVLGMHDQELYGPVESWNVRSRLEQASKGTPREQDVAKAQQFEKDLSEADKKIAAARGNIDATEAAVREAVKTAPKKAPERPAPKNPAVKQVKRTGYGANNRVFTADAYAQAVARRARGGSIRGKQSGVLNIGFQDYKDLVVVVGYHLEARVRDYATLLQKTRDDFGDVDEVAFSKAVIEAMDALKPSAETQAKIKASRSANADLRAQASRNIPIEASSPGELVKVLLDRGEKDFSRIKAEIDARFGETSSKEVADMVKAERDARKRPMTDEQKAAAKLRAQLDFETKVKSSDDPLRTYVTEMLKRNERDYTKIEQGATDLLGPHSKADFVAAAKGAVEDWSSKKVMSADEFKEQAAKALKQKRARAWIETVKTAQDWERASGMKKVDMILRGEVPGLLKNIAASMDDSFWLRQGIFYAVSHPIDNARAFLRHIPAIFSENKYQDIRARMEKERPDRYAMAAQSRLAIKDLPGETHGEENFIRSALGDLAMERLKESAPIAHDVIKNVGPIAVSERAFDTASLIRWDRYNRLADAWEKAGYKLDKDSSDVIAQVVNMSSGKGEIGTPMATTFMNKWLFSARLIASRFQILYGAPLMKAMKLGMNPVKNPVLRSVMGDYAKFAGFILTTKAIVNGLQQRGVDIDMPTDLDDPGFGQVVFNGVRYDISGGLAPTARFIGKEARIFKDAWNGDHPDFGATAWDTLATYMENRTAPIPRALGSVGDRVRNGEEPPTPAQAALGMLFPIGARQGAQNFQAGMPVSDQALSSLMEFWGVSANPQPVKKIKGPLIPSTKGLVPKASDFLPQKSKGIVDDLLHGSG